MKIILFLLIYFNLAYAGKEIVYQDIDTLFLNNQTEFLNSKEKKRLHNPVIAFKWNHTDNKTKKWRPQGITEIVTKNKHFIVVSWYGRKEVNYQNRGVRISIIDISNKKAYFYRHILLVNNKYQTFKGMHAGGIVYINGMLHVADTRNAKKLIHIFDMNKIRKISNKNKIDFYGYKYILKEEKSYQVPIKPSFMSYDYNRNKILLGSFNKCLNKDNKSFECLLNKKNKLAWYSNDIKNAKQMSCAPYFSEMQGAASIKDPYSNSDLLFVSSSYGKNNKSYLHIVNINKGKCYSTGLGMTNYRKLYYPAGLEDIHISKNSKEIWMLTEFALDKNLKNNRVIFSTHIKNLIGK